MYIDTHTHIYDEYFAKDYAGFIQKAKDAGVDKLYMPNCDKSTISSMMQLSKDFPGYCIPMMGLHPCYVKEDFKEELKLVEDWLSKEKFAAVGEIGLDYYWSKEFVAQQKEAFLYQVDLALQYDLPIVIHSRESTADCLELVKQKQNGNLRGVFHCFSGTLEEARAAIGLNFYLGIGGVVTYKNAGLDLIVKELPLGSMVLETDAPYLAPVPYRGKRNESSYLPFIAEKIAAVKGMSVQEVAEVTSGNAGVLFGVPS